MITNKGNDIIAKYLLGNAPEYAAYIAVGVGAVPLGMNESDNSSPTKKSMDFEAFRVPVISKGIVNDTITKDILTVSTTSGTSNITTTTNHGISIGDSITAFINESTTISGVAQSTTSNSVAISSTLPNGVISPVSGRVEYVKDRIIFKAQLPPDQRYEMTEIAVYPAANNQLDVGHDSRSISSFSPTESWFVFGSSNSIEYDSSSISDQNNAITDFVAKYIDSDNMAFYGSSIRKQRHEQPRFLNKCLIVSGDITSFTNDSLDTVSVGSSYISNSNFSLDLSKYSGKDIMKFAISIVSKEEVAPIPPNKIRIRIDLVDVDGKNAISKHIINASHISSSRYIVLTEKIEDFSTPDLTFNWSRINSINIYVQTLNSSGTYDNSYVILDGIRIDNESTTNPLYGMVAYSRLKNNVSNALPIEKIENSQGYIEYRLGVSIF